MINVFGINFRFHPLFILLMGLSIVTGYWIELAALFGVVIIHELGHVVAAKIFGWTVREIQLLPFGGVAVVESSHRVTPGQEIIVALAGPLQNAWMAACAWGLIHFSWMEPEWGQYFIRVNAMIGLFNLLPISPLDGGKITLALMSKWFPYFRVLQQFSLFGAVVGAFIAVAAVIHLNGSGVHFNWLMIGLFLCYSNWMDFRQLPYYFMRFLIQRESRLGHTIRHGIIAKPIVVADVEPIGSIVKLFIRDQYHLIYVLGERGKVRAVLPEHKLLRSLFSESNPPGAVSELFM